VGRNERFVSAGDVGDGVREWNEAEEKCVGVLSDELQLEAGELLDFDRLC